MSARPNCDRIMSIFVVALLSLGIASISSYGRPEAIVLSSSSASNLVHMQIVAHQDDDFLFMNPDLANQIAAGIGTVTVYITAGETNGAPQMCSTNVEQARHEFATARQQGIKAAYAKMAEMLNNGDPVANIWTRELIHT